MRSLYQPLLKKFLREQFLQTRSHMGLSQAQFAELLAMDARSYAYLEKGEYLCGTITFVLFLIKACPDPDALLSIIRDLLLGDDQHVA